MKRNTRNTPEVYLEPLQVRCELYCVIASLNTLDPWVTQNSKTNQI